MKDKARYLASLIKKQNEDDLTENEHLDLENWLSESEKNRQLFDKLNDSGYVQNSVHNYATSLKEWEKLESRSSLYLVKSISKRIYQYAAVAAVLILVSVGAYLLFFSSTNNDEIAKTTPALVNDAAPGGQKAILILPGNKIVSLADVPKGIIAKQGEAAITKTADGKIQYHGSGSSGMHILQTPRGGFYHLTFSDGSKVWLNAETTLRYPATFTGKKRKVEVTGEAYFEVASNKEMPFIVLAGNVEIEVLGTRFNVQSYSDEQNILTTLVEGSVKISTGNQSNTLGSFKILKPDQQAGVVREQQNIQITSVDAENVISWVNGSFYFNDATLKDVMQQISRWYDVSFVISEDFSTQRTFKGSIERNIPLSQVLAELSKMGNFSYQVQESNVIISKNLNEQ